MLYYQYNIFIFLYDVMKKTKKAFSLIEVLTASIILSIAVFWIFKLIWENTKLINNSENYSQAAGLFIPFEECLNYLDFSNFSNKNIWTKYNFNFWALNNFCLIWNTNKIELDNINYELSWKITWSWSNYLNWQLKIFSEQSWILLKEFRQIK
jgi:prepilin-type N-terminal cleavage/methylation domain-containing protein